MFEDRFLRRLRRAFPPERWRDLTVLVAVSGGADSVALLRGLHAIREEGPGRLIVGHYNHQLREAGDADEAWVVDLCRGLDISCELGRGAEPLATNRIGLEAAARRVRYAFLQAAAERLGARYVLTAHTADDQAETLLLRLLRGAGVRGLSGMRRARPLGSEVVLLRPLLKRRRRELQNYLRRIGQPFRTDAMNADSAFTRVRMRKWLRRLERREQLPAIKNLARAAELLGETADYLAESADRAAEQLEAEVAAGRFSLDSELARTLPSLLLRETLRSLWRKAGLPESGMSRQQWRRLERLAVAGVSTGATLPGNVDCRVKAQRLCVQLADKDRSASRGPAADA